MQYVGWRYNVRGRNLYFFYVDRNCFLYRYVSIQMAQFFMKMAEAVQKNTLKPGGSIPGCNSYFLCKYLKDTMLQAR